MLVNNINDNINCAEDHKALPTIVGYDASKHNALKHGILSKYTVMGWENREDYDALLYSLIDEYTPKGVTEHHLVEELAGIIWRKMRLRYAEMTSIQSSLSKCVGVGYSYNSAAEAALLVSSNEIRNFDIKQAVLSTEEETQNELARVKEYLNCCLESEKIILESGSYEDGLAALHEDDQNKWRKAWLREGKDAINSATAEGLLSWIEDDKELYKSKIFELENRSKVKQQIFGKSFFSDKELDKFVRYETHLDRKFEKILTMLLKLKDLRGTTEIKTVVS
jgi:hypothetical protein